MDKRYSRQVLLLGKEGQRKISKSKVAIIGIGALGTAAAELLARAGVGELLLVDRDIVEKSNLQRQLLFREKDLGKSKAKAAEERLKEINSSLKIKSYPLHLHSSNLSFLKGASLILDCTDNLKTRFLLNDFCRKEKIPWIYASAIREEGYVMHILPGGPCLGCFLKEVSLETCDTVGVLNTITTGIAALQVTLSLKILLGQRIKLRLYHLNIWTPRLREIKVRKNSRCRACKGEYFYLNQKEESLTKFCSSGKYQILGKKKDLKILKKRWSVLGKVVDDGISLRFKEIMLFSDGRALIEADSETEARSLYSKYVGD